MGRTALVLCALTVVVGFCSRNSEVFAELKNRDELTILTEYWAQELESKLENVSKGIVAGTDYYYGETVVNKDGEDITNSIASQIRYMMKKKVSAVKRIVESAEVLAKKYNDTLPADLDHFDYYQAKNLTNSLNESDTKEADNPKDEEVTNFSNYKKGDEPIYGVYEGQMENSKSQYDFQYDQKDFGVIEASKEGIDPDGEYPPKYFRTLPLVKNEHFFDLEVNFDTGIIHLPSNIHYNDTNVTVDVKWSFGLDKVFEENYKNDSDLIWQYFCGSSGFMRQYPAIIWEFSHDVDVYDCRWRDWYVEAASSSKDVVILLDRSGSMAKWKHSLAKQVANGILDTLGVNDFFNILTFSNSTDPLIPCIGKDKLVQAHMINIREFKRNLNAFRIYNYTDLGLALTTAFELLKSYREGKKGAGCNQAIMLITDTVEDNYKEVFEKYNWNEDPEMPVRVFTYHIGQIGSNEREITWMACANKGFYSKINNYEEIRESILKYIPVMARPLVLSNYKPSPIWSPLYSDKEDPALPYQIWADRLKKVQQQMMFEYKKNMTDFIKLIRENFPYEKWKWAKNFDEERTYRLMTSVSLPAFDKRINGTKFAKILGVAGVDVTVDFIKSFLKPHLLGPNGYACIVNNNGHIITHPDLRPLYHSILKPQYTTVDLAEVEILEDNRDPRNFSSVLLDFRKKVIMQQSGNITLKIKSTVDNLNRIFIGRRRYFYRGITETPFSLVVSLPEAYGLKTMLVSSQEKIDLNDPDPFQGSNWAIHPEWKYCKCSSRDDENGRERLQCFLREMKNAGWKWNLAKTKNCDKGLTQLLIRDAKLTRSFYEDISNKLRTVLISSYIKEFEIKVVFVATQGGLTRWFDIPLDKEINATDFSIQNRAIDEVWYKRAIDYHIKNQNVFIYSVPFENDNINETVITVSRANSNRFPPAAVIGYQFYYTAFQDIFKTITSKCKEGPCSKTCASEDLDCYLLDNNGYVLVSYDVEETGKFFGEIRPDVMEKLTEKIYKRFRMYDYQFFCDGKDVVWNIASKPFSYIMEIIQWFVGTVFMILQTMFGNTLGGSEYTSKYVPLKYLQKNYYEPGMNLQKTRPIPCDAEFWLYQLIEYPDNIKYMYTENMKGCERPFMVADIVSSNLIFLVVNKLCKEENLGFKRSPERVEINYNKTIACFNAERGLPRRSYAGCRNTHPKEKSIHKCGKASELFANILLFLMCLIISLGL